MSAFSITITGPDGYSATLHYPSPFCADAALRWAAMLRPGYTADTTEAEEAAIECYRLRNEAATKRGKRNGT